MESVKALTLAALIFCIMSAPFVVLSLDFAIQIRKNTKKSFFYVIIIIGILRENSPEAMQMLMYTTASISVFLWALITIVSIYKNVYILIGTIFILAIVLYIKRKVKKS